MAQPTTKQSSSDKTSDVQKQKNLSKVSSGADKKVRDKAYNDYVESITPKHNLAAICCIGQFILNICKSLGLDKEMSGSWCSILLILLSVILTGLNLYPSLANWGGAGALVPITGFANGVAAPAIEFQKEGQVFGIGCKIFTIAGPVILYGIFSSWVLGLIYWAAKMFGFC
ncbi:MAG: stage V sporulation protein AC [Roseburia intestinalis]|nr:MAG: stage V sporulation protein AC [Roseburia intestinalis]